MTNNYDVFISYRRQGGFEVAKHIKGVRLRFLPEGGKDPELSLNSKMFLKRIHLQRVARYEQEDGGEG